MDILNGVGFTPSVGYDPEKVAPSLERSPPCLKRKILCAWINSSDARCRTGCVYWLRRGTTPHRAHWFPYSSINVSSYLFS